MVVCTFVFTGLWHHVLREPLTRYWSNLTSPLLSASRGSRSDNNSSKTCASDGSNGTCRGDLRFEKASDVESGARSEKKDSSSFMEADTVPGHSPPLPPADRRVKDRDWARRAAGPGNAAGITATTTTTVSVSARSEADEEDDDRYRFEGMPPPRRCSRTSTLVNS
jgi:hypothetical protein